MMAEAREGMDVTAGDGERLEQSRTIKATMIRGMLFGAGLVAGAVIGLNVAWYGFGGDWSPPLALGVATLYLIALVAGSVALSRVSDELERVRGYKAVTVAGALYLAIYPVWFLMWKGGLAVEPIHWLLFIGFWLALALATLYYRFR